MSFLKASLLTTSLLAVTMSAQAQEAQRYDSVNALHVENFIGTLYIDIDGSAAKASIENGDNEDYPFTLEEKDGVLSLYSPQDPKTIRWWKKVNSFSGYGDNFAKFLEDYPVIRITLAKGSDLTFDNSVINLDADDIGGNAVIKRGHVRGEIGDLASADVDIHGSADLSIGDVAQSLEISIHGSGDFEAGNAATLVASIHGSGDISLGNIAKDADANIHGSGDVSLEDIGGTAILRVHGSGDINADNVRGGAEISSHGSGEIELASLTGPARATTHGSGDIEIADGRAENLRVRTSGSGKFKFYGTATNSVLRARGSGGIYIRENEGTVDLSGKNIRIGDTR